MFSHKHVREHEHSSCSRTKAPPQIDYESACVPVCCQSQCLLPSPEGLHCQLLFSSSGMHTTRSCREFNSLPRVYTRSARGAPMLRGALPRDSLTLPMPLPTVVGAATPPAGGPDAILVHTAQDRHGPIGEGLVSCRVRRGKALGH